MSRLGVSSSAGGWCLNGARETEPVSQSQLTGRHFCQISLGQVCARPVSTCCGKNLSSCTSWDRKLARRAHLCLSSKQAAVIQGRCQGAGEGGQQPSACLPHRGLSSGLFLTRPGRTVLTEDENPAPHNGVSFQKLCCENSLESLCIIVAFRQVLPQRS